MLRGSSRHDGIPLKQSAKDRDRDRQREQQRKERAQMLPDDKEIHPSAQDLFQPPCKVQQPFEDTTAVQIQNTLGSFDSVRHLILDPSSRRLANLVGVDQGSPVVVRVNPADPHRPSATAPPSNSTTSADGSKGHHGIIRNLFPVNHQSSVGSNNNTSGQTSSLGPNLIATTNCFRTSNPPSTAVQKVPHSQNSQHNTNNYTSTSNLNPPTAPPNFSGPILSTKSPNLTSNNNSSTSSSTNQGNRPLINKPSAHGQSSSNSSSATLLDVNVLLDGISGSSNVDKNNSVFDNVPISNHTSSAPFDKSAKNSSSNKKSTFERADSQLELETILKEMTDVTPPITAIQTSVKDNLTARKQPQRRSSKSEEKIVQSIINSGMASVPSPVSPVPVPKMDSSSDGSSSSLSDSDSESEDSSSGSHSGSENKDKAISQPPSTSSPTQRSWSLHSFIKKPGLDTGGKDDKSNSFSSVDSEQSSEDLIPNPEFVIPLFNQPQSASPLEPLAPVTTATPAANHAPETTGRTRSSAENRLKANIPARQAPSSIPTKGSTLSSKISSLTASSSDEEEEKKPPKKAAAPKVSVAAEDKKTATTGAGTRKRPRRLSTTTVATTTAATTRQTRTKGEGDSSPETANKKKGVQDRNKSDTIRKLFRPVNKAKQDTPNASDVETGKTNNGSTPTTTASTPSTGSGTKQSSSNRVSGKDSGKKKETALHNGQLESAAPSIIANEPASTPSAKGKKDASKDKEVGHNKKYAKQTAAATSVSSLIVKSKSPKQKLELAAALNSILLPPPPPPPSRVKEDLIMKANISHSSLIVRIPLDRIVRKPKTAGVSAAALGIPSLSPALNKKDKEADKGRATGGTNSSGGSAAATPVAAPVGESSSNVPGGSTVAPLDPLRLKIQNNSSRVGSSSDTSNQPFAPVDPSIPRDRDDSLCSDSERLKNHSSKKRPRKKSRSSPRKTKVKRDTETYHPAKTKIKVGEEEISSNVLGYNNCDSLSVTTTRTPPIESDIIQAPDSSLNPPHLPSPVIPQQLQFFSSFEKNEMKDDLFSRDQDSYLEEAKKLKHKADGERSSAAQASMYLEAGLYFILTGILMEREINAISSVYTMFKDTLSLITFIGNRWRARPEINSIVEAKIIILSMRCQALLSMKLFKLKMRETKEMVTFMQTFFNAAPQRDPAIISSPILSTPSPISPTTSPAGSSSSAIFQHTPSPHHHPHQTHHTVTAIPRTLYAQMQKQCSNALYVILAHDTWEQADALVAKHRVEEFFIGIDCQNGPLTLHSSLVDLVRYVRVGLQVLSGS